MSAAGTFGSPEKDGGRSTRTRRSLALALAAALTGSLLTALSAAGPAIADTRPEPPESTPTVSADSLPTVQIDGVVWSQLVVGNTVYVTGTFSSARPAGAALGTHETPRSNILAYDITTGALKTDWAPTLNAQGLGLAASPDGRRIYVAGNFTQVSGKNRYRVAALDAATGEVVNSFAPVLNYRVRSVAVSDDTVYLGGGFTTANGQERNRLAAYDAATGELLDWAPGADQEVMAMVIPAGHDELVVGGRFLTLNGEQNRGMGALDLETGATRPWAANQIVMNYGTDAAIYSLTSDGTNVYGTGYGYLHNNPDTNANLENSFAATADGGELVWANGCKGDTYGNWNQDGVLYTVGHPHDCTYIGGHPQTVPWTFQRSMATTTAVGPDGLVNKGGAFNGRPAPQLLHWQPTLTVGTYTGQGQAAWSVAGNSRYIVLGGEFPSVNGTRQQGLARFPVTSIGPNKEGAQSVSAMTPAVFAQGEGRVRIAWRSAWDRDNAKLVYQVLRGTSANSATVIETQTQNTDWWYRPQLLMHDPDASPGSVQTYRVRVRDPLGNVNTSTSVRFTVPESVPESAYREAVIADGATHLWRLGEKTGGVGYDWAGGEDLTVSPDETRDTDGALLDETDARSTTFALPPPPDPDVEDPPSPAVPATTVAPSPGPQTFSVEAWFNTTSTIGGKIIGFGDHTTNNSSWYDRHIYMTRDGRLAFGVNGNGLHTVTSAAPFNNGEWHHVVGTLGKDGVQLYVDGRRVAGDPTAVGAQEFKGYWRVGGDNLTGWPNRPGQFRFVGALQEVATYAGPLTADQVRAHYEAAGRTPPVVPAPTDRYGAAVTRATPDTFWRLDETSGPAFNTATGVADGTFTSGVTRKQAASPAGPEGVAIRLPGNSEQSVASTVPVDNPTSYSTQVWFRTTTTRGGRLIGFGSAQSGRSTFFDRFVQMLNDGTLRYGTNFEGERAIIDSPESYNDNAWHQVVATQSPDDGMRLYVDGRLVASLESATAPEDYAGYWRIGSDGTWGGASSENFAGYLDEVSIYPRALSAQTVAAQYSAATEPLGIGVVPPRKPAVPPVTPPVTGAPDTAGPSAAAVPPVASTTPPDGAAVRIRQEARTQR